MIGYHLAMDQSLLGMAMTQGYQKKVINIGLGVQHYKLPNRISLSSYIESQQHKVCKLHILYLLSRTNSV
jgi:4'-phosphopantetheinyl transferase